MVTANNKTDGIEFRGRLHRTPKRYTEGTPRFDEPEETLNKVLPVTRRIGVTRIANITGLDRLGIPTFMAVRPAALVPSVSWGKGLTEPQAHLSAAMESIERYHGETSCPPAFTSTYDDLDRRWQRIPLENLPLSKHSLFHPRLRTRWVTGWDIVNQAEVAVPRGLLTLLYFSEPTGLASFQISSNGLAAGTRFLEAVYQALVEVIERDAITCHYEAAEARGETGFLRKVAPDTIRYPVVRELTERIEAARMRFHLYDCTVDTQIPVYGCCLYDQNQRFFGVSKGYGAGLDPQVAMIRAITEAAQSRASHMAGTLDNTSYHDRQFARLNDNEQVINRLASVPETVDASNTRSLATSTFEGDIRLCLEKLQQVGLRQVIVFDLTAVGPGLSVVKVIVPGLEGYRHPYYAPGRRAKAFRTRSRL